MATKVRVCLSFDFDALSLWIGGFRARSLSAISRGEFGRVGAVRILDLMRDRNIKTTWFIPAHSALTYPHIVERVLRDGHEVGNHGVLHTHPKSPEEEAEILDEGNRVLEQMTGARPRGFRSPGAGLSLNMVTLLLDRGFIYDSSLSGDDFTPYYMRVGDRQVDGGGYAFGKPVEVVEIPFTWGLDDFPAFEYVTSRAGIQNGLAAPSAVYEIWAGDFDYLYNRVGKGVYTLTMHPQVIGRGHRMLMLERLIGHIQSHPAIEFGTLLEAATAFKHEFPLNPA